MPSSEDIAKQNRSVEARELRYYMIEGPYRLIYLIRTDEQKVEVLAVVHSSRDPTPTVELIGIILLGKLRHLVKKKS